MDLEQKIKSGSIEKFEIEEPGQEQNELLQKENYHQDNKHLSYKQLFKLMLPYGFVSFGGPMAHVAMLEQRFVEELKFLKSSQFTELFALCQSLPGPTSTQMVIAIGTLVTSSAIGGIISFLTFSFPAAFVLFVSGMVFRYLDQIDFQMDEHVEFALDGFKSAAIAIVAQAAWKLGNNYRQDPTLLLIMAASAVCFYLFQSPWIMIILMLSGGFLNIVLQNMKKSNLRGSINSVISDNEPENQLIKSGNGPFGKISLILFLSILIALPILSYIFKFDLLIYVSSFYYMGSIIIGGGHVILPMILTEFQQFGLQEKLFWNGFSIVSALPGPLFNISIYVGALIDGVIGALLGWFTLFLPAFLMIWGILPFWNKYRSNPMVHKALRGIGAASIGFIITAVYMLWSAASSKDSTSSVLIAISCFIALHIYGCRAPLVVLAGGALMVCRQVVKVKYRGDI